MAAPVIPEARSIPEAIQLVKCLNDPRFSTLVPQISNQLQALQLSPFGWEAADAMLRDDDASVRFYGALTFQVKLNKDGKSLSESDAGNLLKKLWHWFHSSVRRSEGRLVLDKLCSTLATYFIQSSVPWKQAVLHTVSGFYKGPAKPKEVVTVEDVVPQLAPNELYVSLRFCSILAEDVANSDSLSPQHRHLDGLLKENIAAVTLLIRAGLSNPEARDVHSEALNAFSSWINYAQAHWARDFDTLRYLQELTLPIMQFLISEDLYLRDSAIEVFTQILEYHFKFLRRDQANTLAELLCNVLGPQCVSELRGGEPDPSVASTGKLMAAYGKATVQRIVESSDDPISVKLTDFFQETIRGPGYPGDEDEIIIPVTDFWTDYAQYVVDEFEMSSSADDLPWLNVAKERLMRAAASYLLKLRAPPTSEITSWDESTKERWNSFREDVSDMLQSIVALPDTGLLKELVNYALNVLPTRQWLDLEAVLLCLNAVADTAPLMKENDNVLAALMGSTMFQDFSNSSNDIPARAKRQLMRLLDCYSAFVKRRTEFLPAILTFLLSTLASASATQNSLGDAAARSLKSLCSSCRRPLTQHLNELLQQTPQALTGSSTNTYQKEKVMSALASVVQALPTEEGKAQPLTILLEMVENDLNQAMGYISQGNNEVGEGVGTSALQCLASIGEGMQDTTGDVAVDLESEQAPSLSDPRNFWNSSAGQAVQQRILNCFNIVDHLQNQGDAIDAACSVLRAGLKETAPGPFVFPPSVTAGFVSKGRLNTPRVEAMLITGCAFVSANSRHATNRLVSEVHQIYQAAVSIIQELGQPGNDPGLAEICIDLTERLLARYVDVLLSISDEELGAVFNFTLRCMVGEAPILKRLAANFFTTFIDLTGPNARTDLPSTRIPPAAVISEFSPLLASALMNEIGGNAQRSELDSLCKPLRSFIFTQPAAKRHLEQALVSSQFPSQNVGDADKRTFLQKVTMLRGGRQTNIVVKEFWAVCKGTIRDEDDANQDSNSDGRYAHLVGITPKESDRGERYYLVEWESEDDPQNPHNWSKRLRLRSTLIINAVAFIATAASSIDSAVLMPAAMEFHVSEVAESLATAVFLIGFGIGALLASPLSELMGRYPVYLGTLAIFGIWLMASALAPNFGAQIVFRYLAGCFASAPSTTAGGSMSDIWNPMEKTWGFPIFAVTGFGGSVLGPVIDACIGFNPHNVISWRWSEWIMLITDDLVILLVLAFKQETLASQLLKYKVRHFRQDTGDEIFKSQAEAAGGPLGEVLETNFFRPFILSIEPIVAAFTLYLMITYIVLFNFLDGELPVGILLSFTLVPLVYNTTKKRLSHDGDSGKGEKLNQESRLLFAMVGAPVLPIGLFWMGWTDYPSISIWSPIIASVAIGFSIISIFLSAYMCVIDSYETYAASALTFVALIRYPAAGGMTVVGIPMYRNLGTHYTLTVLACILAAVVPIPYALYKWGSKVREKSKYAVSPGS